MDEHKEIEGITMTQITSLYPHTQTLFDVLNSSIILRNMNFEVDHAFRIAQLKTISSILISESVIDFKFEVTPFSTDGGDVTLLDIVLRGSSLIPELVSSSSLATHVSVSNFRCTDAIVGSAPIFGSTTYSVEISHSHFSNLDHIVSNELPDPLTTGCFTDIVSSEYATILAYSSMKNVTDDVYGGVTNAALTGESFAFTDIKIEQQTIKADLRQRNKEYTRSVYCAVLKNFKISKYDISETEDTIGGYAGMVVELSGAVKLTVSSCSFTNLKSENKLAGLSIEAFQLSKSDHCQVSVTNCNFKNCSARWMTHIGCGLCTIELNQVTWRDCTASDAILTVTGLQRDPLSSSPGLSLKSIGFENCPKVDDPSFYTTYNCLYALYAGAITISDQTTFRNCYSILPPFRVHGVTTVLKETRMEDCGSSVGRAGAGLVEGFHVSVQDVLIQRCEAAIPPNGLIVSLFWDINFMEKPAETVKQTYSIKNVQIEHSQNAHYFVDVMVAVNKTALDDGKLNYNNFKNVRSDVGRLGVGLIHFKPSPVSGNSTYEDHSSSILTQGTDPRSDRGKKSALEKGPASSSGVIVTIIVVVVVVVVLVIVVIIIVVVVVRHKKKKKTADTTDGGTPSKENESAPASNESSEPAQNTQHTPQPSNQPSQDSPGQPQPSQVHSSYPSQGTPQQSPYPPQGPPQGYPPQGYPQGYPQQSYPPQGYPPNGPPGAYPPQGYPPQGYPPPGAYPPQGYPPQGVPPQGVPPQGYPPVDPNAPAGQYPPQGPPQGYPPQGYPPQGFPQGSYPPPGAYPPQGYPPQGYPPQGTK
ncbi:hypothetical protein BLNAU_6219 [Blattamonas nauphoetae]|uniref:Rhodopsin n=1 Tax=Blattamonas nauphoetae TaxID=2049346 RepID=A0ABQ9Y4P9_9EUKA|nr:hypothetical protein BLNAU_6219 [Blattamonas nauphoetae]